MTKKTLKIFSCLIFMLSCNCYLYASVDIKDFPPEVKRLQQLEYAWASCESHEKDCMVIIWIRGVKQDTRIIINGKVDKTLCHVEIPAKVFDKYFKYVVLAGFSSNDKEPMVASFGGGPAGGRDFYWFEWSTNVNPSFYCILR